MTTPIIKYEATGFRFGGGRIEAVQVTRETESSIWIGDRRSAKESEHACFFDSWQAAHAYLLSCASNRVEHARRALQRANDDLGNVKGMKEPS